MKRTKITPSLNLGLLPFITLLVFSVGCQKNFESVPGTTDPNGPTLTSAKNPQTLKDFTQVNLVGDNNEYAPARIDPVLVNAWGLAFSGTGNAWLSAEGTGKSTIYNKEGLQLLAPVSIPSPGAATGGHPTGIVFSNSATDFRLLNNNPARFIFAGADGVISGWNPGNISTAIRMINNSATASYLGLALASDAGHNFLYAANFKEGKIDVFNSTWMMVSKPFTDPGLPAGYSPFNIQAINNHLYVMYAKIGADGDEIKHPGYGVVDEYNPDGSFIKRLITYGQLNAPWGIVKAPAGFYGDGGEADTYLVGNFGDGRINAFTDDGNFLGQLRMHGNPIIIEGLWALSFPPATATTIDPNRLYFTAGPDDEEHGLFGYIIK